MSGVAYGAARTSWAAVAALVFSLLGVWIVGLPLGLVARREIEESGGTRTGRGYATAAVVFGLIGLLVTVLAIAALLLGSTSSTSSR